VVQFQTHSYKGVRGGWREEGGGSMRPTLRERRGREAAALSSREQGRQAVSGEAPGRSLGYRDGALGGQSPHPALAPLVLLAWVYQGTPWGLSGCTGSPQGRQTPHPLLAGTPLLPPVLARGPCSTRRRKALGLSDLRKEAGLGWVHRCWPDLAHGTHLVQAATAATAPAAGAAAAVPPSTTAASATVPVTSSSSSRGASYWERRQGSFVLSCTLSPIRVTQTSFTPGLHPPPLSPSNFPLLPLLLLPLSSHPILALPTHVRPLPLLLPLLHAPSASPSPAIHPRAPTHRDR